MPLGIQSLFAWTAVAVLNSSTENAELHHSMDDKESKDLCSSNELEQFGQKSLLQAPDLLLAFIYIYIYIYNSVIFSCKLYIS
jgi:hypothetical protein